MKKVLIIEDELFCAKRMKKLISDFDDTIDIHGPLKSVTEVVAELTASNDYDLIISDIRLIDGEVFEAFQRVRPRSFVIFATAYDEYAMQAIRNNGLDYLLKPVDFKELCAAMDKLKLASPAHHETAMDNLLHDVHQYRERFLVNMSDELVVLNVDDINYFCIENNHVVAFTDENIPFPISMSMSDLEESLDPGKFFRINRQYIANIKGIKKISLFFSSRLVVRLKGCPEDSIVISKDKSAELKKWLDR